MAITLITGVPGTGKTAFLVSELEKIAATGRVIFADNIPGLLIPHYRAGKVTEWQKGTWLHIDQYKRIGPLVAIANGKSPDDEDDEGNIYYSDDYTFETLPTPKIVGLSNLISNSFLPRAIQGGQQCLKLDQEHP